MHDKHAYNATQRCHLLKLSNFEFHIYLCVFCRLHSIQCRRHKMPKIQHFAHFYFVWLRSFSPLRLISILLIYFGVCIWWKMHRRIRIQNRNFDLSSFFCCCRRFVFFSLFYLSEVFARLLFSFVSFFFLVQFVPWIQFDTMNLLCVLFAILLYIVFLLQCDPLKIAMSINFQSLLRLSSRLRLLRVWWIYFYFDRCQGVIETVDSSLFFKLDAGHHLRFGLFRFSSLFYFVFTSEKRIINIFFSLFGMKRTMNWSNSIECIQQKKTKR